MNKYAYAVNYFNMLKTAGPVWKAFRKSPIRTMWNLGSEMTEPQIVGIQKKFHSVNPGAIKRDMNKATETLTNKANSIQNKITKLEGKKTPNIFQQTLDPNRGERIAKKVNVEKDNLSRIQSEIANKQSALKSQYDEAKGVRSSARAELHRQLPGLKAKRAIFNTVGRGAILGTGVASIYGGSKIYNRMQQQPQPQQVAY